MKDDSDGFSIGVTSYQWIFEPFQEFYERLIFHEDIWVE
jgi:hypothetical protein